MALPSRVLDFLKDNARSARVEEPESGDDLFQSGVLDSFSLIDLVAVLEEQTGIKVPDVDVNPANFQTIDAIERYVNSRNT